MFHIPPPDGSRDARIEDPTNRWLIHPIGRALLPLALRLRISANAISCAGLALGGAAAAAYSQWPDPLWLAVGLALSIAWLVADGLDGMVARATGTASRLGRILDGLCDHGVFVLIYVALAYSVGMADVWVLAACAGACHAVQSSLYEAERTRYHRRRRGDPGEARGVAKANPVVGIYDAVYFSLDRFAARFDARLRESADPVAFGGAYALETAPAYRVMALLSANTRVFAIWISCALGDPRAFWWFEIVPLTLVCLVALFWVRRREMRIIRDRSTSDQDSLA